MPTAISEGGATCHLLPATHHPASGGVGAASANQAGAVALALAVDWAVALIFSLGKYNESSIQLTAIPIGRLCKEKARNVRNRSEIATAPASRAFTSK